MKQFISKIRFFILLLLVLWAALEAFYRFVPNNYTQKNSGVQAHYNSCQVLILGNSHALYGLNPAFFNREAYNLANISQTLFFDEMLLKGHIDSLKNLKAIILPIEYSSLTQPDSHPELQWRKYFYAAQMHVPDSSIAWYDPKKYSLALVPRFSISIKSAKKYFAGEKLYECDEHGWAPLNGGGEANNPETAKAVVQKHEKGSTGYDLNLGRVKNIIAQCRKRGVTVFLVSLPVTPFYAAEANLQRVAIIAKLCTQLADGRGVFYKSYFNDPYFSGEDFYDIDHLNTAGAEKCSKLINRFVEDNLN